MAMGIDDRLLNTRSQETSPSDETEENQAASEASDSSVDDRTAAFNQNQAEARQEQAASQAQTQKQEQKKLADVKPNQVNSASCSCLKQAWLNLIPSWGLTLIWINIHVFLGTVFSDKVFCKLGMEWVPDQIKKAQFEEAKKLGKVAGVFEGGGLACLDLSCLVILLSIITVIYILVDNIFVRFVYFVYDFFN